MNELEEGKSYIINNFVVAQNGREYKVMNHAFRINFFYSTCLKDLDASPIKHMMFKFVSFDIILSQNLDNPFLIGKIS